VRTNAGSLRRGRDVQKPKVSKEVAAGEVDENMWNETRETG